MGTCLLYPGPHRVLDGSFLTKERSNVLITMLCGFWQALGLRRDDTFSVTMLGHCIEMYIGDSEAYIGKIKSFS